MPHLVRLGCHSTRSNSLVFKVWEARQEARLQPTSAMQQEVFFDGQSITQIIWPGLSDLRGAGRSAQRRLDADMVCGVSVSPYSVRIQLRQDTTDQQLPIQYPHCPAPSWLLSCSPAFVSLSHSVTERTMALCIRYVVRCPPLSPCVGCVEIYLAYPIDRAVVAAAGQASRF